MSLYQIQPEAPRRKHRCFDASNQHLPKLTSSVTATTASVLRSSMLVQPVCYTFPRFYPQFLIFASTICFTNDNTFYMHKAMHATSGCECAYISMHGCYAYSATATKPCMCYPAVKNFWSTNLQKCLQDIYSSLQKDS